MSPKKIAQSLNRISFPSLPSSGTQSTTPSSGSRCSHYFASCEQLFTTLFQTIELLSKSFTAYDQCYKTFFQRNYVAIGVTCQNHREMRC